MKTNRRIILRTGDWLSDKDYLSIYLTKDIEVPDKLSYSESYNISGEWKWKDIRNRKWLANELIKQYEKQQTQTDI